MRALHPQSRAGWARLCPGVGHPAGCHSSNCPPLSPPQAQISHYADSVAFHLAKILESDKHSVVISSAK